MIDFDIEKKCYGCRNCEIVCPKKAITIIENEEGFLVPKIDKQKCINCGLCSKKCPRVNAENKIEIKNNQWYSCYLKNVEDRIKSTSGGIFPALANFFIQNDGYVCGCVWDENMKPIHIVTNNVDDVEGMRGSKYMQSDLKETLNEIKSKINEHKILFTGTPCQVAAAKLYLGDHENLYTCSLICEGAGSYKVWKKYVDFLECKYKSKMKLASFRNKEIGWDSPVAKYEFYNKKVRKTLSYEYDIYVIGFLQALYYRNSCSDCQYKGNGHNADLIIGDLWGASSKMLQKTQNKGISVVIENSKKGTELLRCVAGKFSIESINPEIVIKYNKLLMESKEKNKNRDRFYKNIDKKCIVKNIKENVCIKQYKRIIKEVLYKTKIFRKIKELKNK